MVLQPISLIYWMTHLHRFKNPLVKALNTTNFQQSHYNSSRWKLQEKVFTLINEKHIITTSHYVFLGWNNDRRNTYLPLHAKIVCSWPDQCQLYNISPFWQWASYTHFRESRSPVAFHTNCTLSNPLLHIHYYSFFHWLHFPPLPPCICLHPVHTSLLYPHSFLPHSLLQHNQDNLQQNISKHAMICTVIHIKLDPNRKYCTNGIIFKGLPLPTFPDVTSRLSLWVLTFTGHALIYCKSACTHSSRPSI